MIKPNAKLSISRQCELLSVSRSSLYYRPKPDLDGRCVVAVEQIELAGPSLGHCRLR